MSKNWVGKVFYLVFGDIVLISSLTTWVENLGVLVEYGCLFVSICLLVLCSWVMFVMFVLREGSYFGVRVYFIFCIFVLSFGISWDMLCGFCFSLVDDDEYRRVWGFFVCSF